MTPLGHSQRPQGRSARVRDAVLSAALELTDSGDGSPTLYDIAERAGVAPSSIYRRWGSWENVLADALLESSELAIPVPDSGSLRADLIAFTTSVADYLNTPRGAALLRNVGTMQPSAEVEAALQRFWATRFDRARVMVDRAIDRGELPDGTDARLLLELVIAPLHFRHSLLAMDPRGDIEARIDLVLARVGDR
ncbi:TetR/AcrR family transcriptional regulator C-terminal ligand-binding domain-containing protein [Streptomyces sp. NPDC096068]|uniref:TetR/AcrR family transcriptional regulator n=1 Tax=Streptomyces sp. NPDC096068 TaxID=3155424 RepID=UPI003327098E